MNPHDPFSGGLYSLRRRRSLDALSSRLLPQVPEHHDGHPAGPASRDYEGSWPAGLAHGPDYDGSWGAASSMPTSPQIRGPQAAPDEPGLEGILLPVPTAPEAPEACPAEQTSAYEAPMTPTAFEEAMHSGQEPDPVGEAMAHFGATEEGQHEIAAAIEHVAQAEPEAAYYPPDPGIAAEAAFDQAMERMEAAFQGPPMM